MKRILVVDNHPVIRKFMFDLLSDLGHHVLTAGDGLSALEVLETFIPDVVFIDLVMPNIDGSRLCRIIRSRKELNGCIIVVLSAIVVEEKTKNSLKNLDVDIILAKGPFDKLAWQVEYIIKHAEAGRMDRLKGEIIGGKNLTHRQITKELLCIKSRFEMTLNSISEGIVELTPEGKLTYANPASLSLINKPEESLLSTDFVALFKPGDQAELRRKISNVGKIWQEPVVDEIMEMDDRLISVKIASYPDEERQYNLMAMLKDVTQEKQANRHLLDEKEKYRQERNFLDNILINSPDAIVIVDEHGKFTRWNHRAVQLFGYGFEELKENKAFELYADLQARERMLEQLRKEGYVQNYEIDFVRRDGSIAPCAVSISMLYDENQRKIGSLSIIRDLTEWKTVEKKLKYMSFHDSLTGIYNRAFFEEEIERLAKGRHLPLGIIICDIDSLKVVNDALGHQKGDELIQKTSDILKKSFRASEIIARIGGDEFAVLLPEGGEETIKNCIKRIREETEKSNAGANEREQLSISIGYAVGEEIPLDTRSLFKEADDNMYLEKFRKK
ncbi:MAG: diguanylate cyclase [Desulfobacteraceae bacterium]|nr:diguanylate cyclase [Desulfobacteraceae bacterium]